MEEEEFFTVDDSFFDSFGSSDEEESDDFIGVEDTAAVRGIDTVPCVVISTDEDTTPEMSGIPPDRCKKAPMKIWSCCGSHKQRRSMQCEVSSDEEEQES